MQWLTMEQVKDRFQIKDTRTITVKFAKMGLKFIKIGNKYRFDLKDIEKFEEKQSNFCVIIAKKQNIIAFLYWKIKLIKSKLGLLCNIEILKFYWQKAYYIV